MKKIIAFIMAVISAFSVMSFSAFANDSAEEPVIVTVEETDFVFYSNTSEEFRDKVIADYITPVDDDTEIYGLICTLFGHKLESSVVKVVTHKKSATDPRCLEETFNVETCSRCDYSNKTLLGSRYISCC